MKFDINASTHEVKWLTDDWQHMIDSTTVRGHSQAAGARGGPVRKALVEAAVA